MPECQGGSVTFIDFSYESTKLALADLQYIRSLSPGFFTDYSSVIVLSKILSKHDPYTYFYTSPYGVRHMDRKPAQY